MGRGKKKQQHTNKQTKTSGQNKIETVITIIFLKKFILHEKREERNEKRVKRK